MKQIIALGCLVLGLNTLAAENPKVAVLDVVIPKGFDHSVVIPITENIIEELVRSNTYIVLDRNNITAIFKEKEFQLSGEVTDKDIAQAGQLLGANYVVVSKMQQVGDTYFLTSKMINITTGAIERQASHSKEGKLTVLLSMAYDVGRSLATGERLQSTIESSPATSASSKPASNVAPNPVSPSVNKPMLNLAILARYTSNLSPLVIQAGQKLYLQVGLHPDKRGSLSAANFQNSEYLAPGTEITVVSIDKDTLKFNTASSKLIYSYQLHKQAKEDFNIHLTRIFDTGWNPDNLKKLSNADKEGVASGKVKPGMSREGVALTLGYPPRIDNPDLNVPRWIYYKSSFDRIALNWSSSGTLESIKD